MPEASRELTLYVQSKKAVTSFYRPPTSSSANPMSTSVGSTASNDPEAAAADESVYFLSDDQARCVALAEEIATQRGYHLKVVDVAKSGRLERLVTEHLRNVQTFPVLISPLSVRLEGSGAFTQVGLSSVMPTELTSVRAFTYLKIRGGDLDRIRRLLEAFTEVKELHFLTGDWDMLVVLQFPPSSSNKRRVLDFVTERIRGIPEVLDTSTVVPEYSVTKFPIPH
ncbi:MAG: Lrp/AsnC ligand binding domain-containing protein [Thermoplasmata archaeon]